MTKAMKPFRVTASILEQGHKQILLLVKENNSFIAWVVRQFVNSLLEKNDDSQVFSPLMKQSGEGKG